MDIILLIVILIWSLQWSWPGVILAFVSYALGWPWGFVLFLFGMFFLEKGKLPCD